MEDLTIDELIDNPWKKKCIQGDKLLIMDIPKPDWLVPNFLPCPGLVAITGAPGSYKTFFMHWVAMRLAAGLSVFGLGSFAKPDNGMDIPYKTPLKVLFVEEEMNLGGIQERSLDMVRMKGGENLIWLVMEGFKLGNKLLVDYLKDIVQTNGVKLLILDPFSSIAGMKDENSNAEAAKIMDTLRKEFVEIGITVVFIHHPAKGSEGSNIRGAGDILGKCDMHFTIRKVGEEPTNTIEISCGKSRLSRMPDSFTAELVPDGQELGRLAWHYKGSAKDTREAEDAVIREKIKNLLEEGEMTQRAVANALEIKNNDRSFRRVWSSLVDNSEIVQKSRTSWGLYQE